MEQSAGEQNTNYSRLPVSIGKTIWSNLPVLLIMDAALFVSAIPAIILFFSGGFLLLPFVGAVTLGPLWAGAIAVTDRAVLGEHVSLRFFVASVWHYARRGIVVSAVPAVLVTVTLGTGAILAARPDAQWLFVPLIVDCIVLILATLAWFSVFSLATTGGLRGWALWQGALWLVAASPIVTLGTVAIFILLGALVSWIPGIVPVLPSFIAVHFSAFTWATLWRSDSMLPRC